MRKFFSRSNLLLILASIIWGCAFVAQNVGMNYIGPWTFSTIRFLIAGFSLLAIIPILDKKRTHVIRPKTKEEKKKLLLGSVLCGLALSIGSIVQQIAMLTVPVAKAVALGRWRPHRVNTSAAPADCCGAESRLRVRSCAAGR